MSDLLSAFLVWARKPAVLVLWLFGALAPLHAARYELGPVADSTVFSTLQPSTAYDAVSDGGPNLWVSTTAGDVVRRALLRFDLSAIPAGSRVTSVQLKLTQLRARSSHPVTVHRLLASWQPAVSTAGDSGQGTTALPSDVTWSHRSYPSLPWGTRGGDFDPVPSASLVVAATSTFTYVWPSTPKLMADVQSWIDAPSTNHGLIFIGDEVNSQSAKRFAGQEFDDASVQPTLVIDVDPPLPAISDSGDVPLPLWAVLFLGGGLLALLGRRS